MARAALLAVLCSGATAQTVQFANGVALARWAAGDVLGQAFGTDGTITYVPGWLSRATYFHVESFGGPNGSDLQFIPRSAGGGDAGGGSGPQGRGASAQLFGSITNPGVPVPTDEECLEEFFVVDYQCTAASCTPGGDLTDALLANGWERVTTSDNLRFITPQGYDFQQTTTMWKYPGPPEIFTLPQTMGGVTYLGIFANPCDVPPPPGPNPGPVRQQCADFCLSRLL